MIRDLNSLTRDGKLGGQSKPSATHAHRPTAEAGTGQTTTVSIREAFYSSDRQADGVCDDGVCDDGGHSYGENDRSIDADDVDVSRRNEGVEDEREHHVNLAEVSDYRGDNETPNIRLTAEKGDHEDDFDASEIESELAALYKIVSERATYEGELRS